MAQGPPPALTLSLVKEQRGCTEKVVSIVVAAAIAKDGELLALPFRVRYKMNTPWRQSRELKRSENKPSIEIAGKSKQVSLKDTRDGAAWLKTVNTPRAPAPDANQLLQHFLLLLQ